MESEAPPVETESASSIDPSVGLLTPKKHVSRSLVASATSITLPVSATLAHPATLGVWQAPLTHCCPLMQGCPQPPQLRKSELVLAQTPVQQVVPPHVWPQAPQLFASELKLTQPRSQQS